MMGKGHQSIPMKFAVGRSHMFWHSPTQGTYMKPETIARKQRERAERATKRAPKK